MKTYHSQFSRISFHAAVISAAFLCSQTTYAVEAQFGENLWNLTKRVGQEVNTISAEIENVKFTICDKVSEAQHSLGFTVADNVSKSQHSLAFTVCDKVSEAQHSLGFTVADNVSRAQHSLAFTVCDKVSEAQHSLGFTVADNVSRAQHSLAFTVCDKVSDAQETVCSKLDAIDLAFQNQVSKVCILEVLLNSLIDNLL